MSLVVHRPSGAQDLENDINIAYERKCYRVVYGVDQRLTESHPDFDIDQTMYVLTDLSQVPDDIRNNPRRCITDAAAYALIGKEPPK